MFFSMPNVLGKQTDFIWLAVLSVVFIALYAPVWSAEYLYTDEATQLWRYGKEPGFNMFAPQGRFLTDKLFNWLFGSMTLIREIKYIRIFSFAGWLLTLPVWYFLLKKLFAKEGLNETLAFFTVLFIICSPTVSIAVLWASCLELFLANIFGFLSGYFIYTGIKTVDGRIEVPTKAILASLIFGVVSLFTYQNGFGFFFLPFIIHALSPARRLRYVGIGIGMGFFICVVYFMLFKYGLRAEGLAASDRTNLFIAPSGKLQFFFRALSSGFHYTFLFNENDKTGYIVYACLFGSWIMLFLLRKTGPLLQRVQYIALLLFLLILSYLPSLLVRENYASNRTLLALNTAVLVLTVEMFFYYVHQKKTQLFLITLTSLLFLSNAWYNVNRLFLKPVTTEYARLRSYIEMQYQSTSDTVYFVRPQEDFFVKQYGITRSWDEFGVPSTFFSWVPEYFVRQVVFEKTGDRKVAEALVIKNVEGINTSDPVFIKSPGALSIVAEEVIAQSR